MKNNVCPNIPKYCSPQVEVIVLKTEAPLLIVSNTGKWTIPDNPNENEYDF